METCKNNYGDISINGNLNYNTQPATMTIAYKKEGFVAKGSDTLIGSKQVKVAMAA